MGHSLSHYRRFWYYLALLLLFLVSERASLAGSWSIVPSVYVAASHNNNIFLSPPGAGKSDTILQLNPEIRLNGKGKRGSVSLYYEMQNIFYAKNTKFNDTFHILNARANAELVPKLFFIDTTLGRTQQIISRNTGAPLDNISISANRTNVDVVSVSPYIKTNIGNKLTTEIRYASAWTRYDRDILADIRNQTVYADLRNDLTSSRGQWAIIYTNREYEPDTGENYSYERAYIDVDFSVTGKLGLLASAGYENNGYNQSAVTRSEKSSTWDAGLRWSPERNNSISIRLGERAFGKTRSLDFSYRTQRWTWGVGYSEEFRNNLSVLIRNQQSDNPDISIILPGDSTPTIETYLSRRSDFSARRSYGKTDIAFSVYDRRREFQQTGQKEHISGGEVKLDWRFQKRSKFLLGFNKEKQKLRGGFNNYDLIIGTIGLDRRLSRKSNLKFDYRYYQRDSNNFAQNDYKQNQVTLGLTVIF